MRRRSNRPREPRGSRKRAVVSRAHTMLHAVLAAADDAGRAARALPPPVGGFARACAWLAAQPHDVVLTARRWLHAIADEAPTLLLARTTRGEIAASVVVRAAAHARLALRDGADVDPSTVREIEAGEAPHAINGRGRRALASWLHHTFTRWPVPRWVTSSMMAPGGLLRAACDPADDAPLPIMAHVGQGRSWRTAPLPSSIALTRALAHELATTHVEGPRLAIRTAQMRAHGLHAPRSAATVATSFSQEPFGSRDVEACRMRFVEWVARSDVSDFDLALLVAWIEHELRHGDGPTFSFTGRTPRSLVARAHAVARENARLARKLGLLPRSGIAGGTVELRERAFRFVELDSGVALLEEGARRRHCVGRYFADAQRGRCAVFRVDDALAPRPEVGVTVEVELRSRRVVQVKGLLNRPPTHVELDAIKRWAARAGLALSQ